MEKLSYSNIENTLTVCFLEQWNNETPVVLANALQDTLPDNCTEWVRFSVLQTASMQDSLGVSPNRRFLRMGRVYVQVYVKSGLLTDRLAQLCSKVVDIYESITLSPLRIVGISQETMPDGADEIDITLGDGTWFGTMINVQYQFDEVK